MSSSEVPKAPPTGDGKAKAILAKGPPGVHQPKLGGKGKPPGGPPPPKTPKAKGKGYGELPTTTADGMELPVPVGEEPLLEERVEAEPFDTSTPKSHAPASHAPASHAKPITQPPQAGNQSKSSAPSLTSDADNDEDLDDQLRTPPESEYHGDVLTMTSGEMTSGEYNDVATEEVLLMRHEVHDLREANKAMETRIAEQGVSFRKQMESLMKLHAMKESTKTTPPHGLSLEDQERALKMEPSASLAFVASKAAEQAVAHEAARIGVAATPGDPVAAAVASSLLALRHARQLPKDDDDRSSRPGWKSSLGGSRPGDNKPYVWYLSKYGDKFPHFPDGKTRHQPKLWREYWEAVKVFQEMLSLPDEIIVYLIKDKCPWNGELHITLDHLRMLPDPENPTHRDLKTITLEELKELIASEHGPWKNAMADLSEKEFKLLHRKFRERPQWYFRRFDEKYASYKYHNRGVEVTQYQLGRQIMFQSGLTKEEQRKLNKKSAGDHDPELYRRLILEWHENRENDDATRVSVSTYGQRMKHSGRKTYFVERSWDDQGAVVHEGTDLLDEYLAIETLDEQLAPNVPFDVNDPTFCLPDIDEEDQIPDDEWDGYKEIDPDSQQVLWMQTDQDGGYAGTENNASDEWSDSNDYEGYADHWNQDDDSGYGYDGYWEAEEEFDDTETNGVYWTTVTDEDTWEQYWMPWYWDDDLEDWQVDVPDDGDQSIEEASAIYLAACRATHERFGEVMSTEDEVELCTDYREKIHHVLIAERDKNRTRVKGARKGGKGKGKGKRRFSSGKGKAGGKGKRKGGSKSGGKGFSPSKGDHSYTPGGKSKGGKGKGKPKGARRGMSPTRGYHKKGGATEYSSGKGGSSSIPHREVKPTDKCSACDNKTTTGAPTVPHYKGDLVCPRVQAGLDAPHPRWNKFKDQFKHLNWDGPKAVPSFGGAFGKTLTKGNKGASPRTSLPGSGKGGAQRGPNGQFKKKGSGKGHNVRMVSGDADANEWTPAEPEAESAAGDSASASSWNLVDLTLDGASDSGFSVLSSEKRSEARAVELSLDANGWLHQLGTHERQTYAVWTAMSPSSVMERLYRDIHQGVQYPRPHIQVRCNKCDLNLKDVCATDAEPGSKCPTFCNVPGWYATCPKCKGYDAFSVIDASVKLLEFDKFLERQAMPNLRPFPGSEPEKPPDWDGFQDCVDDTAGDAEMAARLATTLQAAQDLDVPGPNRCDFCVSANSPNRCCVRYGIVPDCVLEHSDGDPKFRPAPADNMPGSVGRPDDQPTAREIAVRELRSSQNPEFTSAEWIAYKDHLWTSYQRGSEDMLFTYDFQAASFHAEWTRMMFEYLDTDWFLQWITTHGRDMETRKAAAKRAEDESKYKLEKAEQLEKDRKQLIAEAARRQAAQRAKAAAKLAQNVPATDMPPPPAPIGKSRAQGRTQAFASATPKVGITKQDYSHQPTKQPQCHYPCGTGACVRRCWKDPVHFLGPGDGHLCEEHKVPLVVPKTVVTPKVAPTPPGLDPPQGYPSLPQVVPSTAVPRPAEPPMKAPPVHPPAGSGGLAGKRSLGSSEEAQARWHPDVKDGVHTGWTMRYFATGATEPSPLGRDCRDPISAVQRATEQAKQKAHEEARDAALRIAQRAKDLQAIDAAAAKKAQQEQAAKLVKAAALKKAELEQTAAFRSLPEDQKEEIARGLAAVRTKFGLNKDGSEKKRPPSRWEKYYASSKAQDATLTSDQIKVKYRAMIELEEEAEAAQTRQLLGLKGPMIDLNTCDISALHRIRVDKKVCAKLIEARQKNMFRTWAEVLGVKDVGGETVKLLRVHCFNPEKPIPMAEEQPAEASEPRAKRQDVLVVNTRPPLDVVQVPKTIHIRNHVLLVKIEVPYCIIDSGCDRSVAGRKAHRQQQQVLAGYGLKSIRDDRTTESFTFGDQETAWSDCNYVYPIGIGGKFRGEVNQSCVKPECPSLISKQLSRQWKLITDFGAQITIIDQWGVKEPFQNSSPVLNIFDFGNPDTFDPNKAGIPLKFIGKSSH